MNGPSDDFILNGAWHKCVCGAQYSDSDGGPCHWTCDNCGDIVDDETLCGCAIVGIPLRLLRRIERELHSEHGFTERELHAEIEEMRVMDQEKSR
jgi:hypothetical protein